jgi:hypothetical protein
MSFGLRKTKLAVTAAASAPITIRLHPTTYRAA